MKYVFSIITCIIFFNSVAYAQNIQLHYDFGEDRKMVTTTIEDFKVDEYGSTFFFVDFEYGSEASGVDGVSLAYMELARELKFWNNPFALQAEYNGGLLRTQNFAGAIHNAYLLGGTYTFSSSDFSKILNLKALYKYIDFKDEHAFQFTAVWGVDVADGKVSFDGFADFWKEENVFFEDGSGTTETDFVFLAEPQLWYNINRSFSVGSEVELSNNFGGNKGFMVNPTLAIKWTL